MNFAGWTRYSPHKEIARFACALARSVLNCNNQGGTANDSSLFIQGRFLCFYTDSISLLIYGGISEMKASEIRSKWLAVFCKKGHKIEPSASLVPHNDPSLLWINAGMAPLKAIF